MGVIGGELAYRFLRAYSPGASRDRRDGLAYVGRNKLRVLLGDQRVEELKGKRVLDFGCGHGEHTIAMALEGARFVTGLDIQEAPFPAARQRADAAGVANRVEFVTTSSDTFDVVVSLDSFEHFAEPERMLALMRDRLVDDGLVMASFGPPWFHPLGGHLFSVFPWAHLLFTEAALIRWRSDFKTDGARRFGEVAGGLNQMTIGRFERMVAASGFDVVMLRAVPIRRLERLHNRVTREFTTAVVQCVLRKSSTRPTSA